ncbi:MAG: PadR family transcriptional regulator [Oscillospiraceae bacterium]|jgi:PadR family transcriptional regulator PadR|nr:PadR family transcriptional regulator [Oscillospiraceae bacterium]
MITQFKKGALELCVLVQLRDRDKYGYELATAISAEIEVSLGTIYPLLKRVKQLGYVETETQESTDGPARKYYHLTAKGNAALADHIAEWSAFVKKINKMIGVDSNE